MKLQDQYGQLFIEVQKEKSHHSLMYSLTAECTDGTSQPWLKSKQIIYQKPTRTTGTGKVF